MLTWTRGLLAVGGEVSFCVFLSARLQTGRGGFCDVDMHGDLLDGP